jgi:GT2 family glycosyltransferase
VAYHRFNVSEDDWAASSADIHRQRDRIRMATHGTEGYASLTIEDLEPFVEDLTRQIKRAKAWRAEHCNDR